MKWGGGGVERHPKIQKLIDLNLFLWRHAVHEQFDHVRVVGSHAGVVQRRSALVVARVDSRAAGQQQPRDAQLVVRRRVVQRSGAVLICDLQAQEGSNA